MGCNNQSDAVSHVQINEKAIKTFPKQKIEKLNKLLSSIDIDSALIDFYKNKSEFIWFNVNLEKNSYTQQFLDLLLNSTSYGVDSNKHDLAEITRLI